MCELSLISKTSLLSLSRFYFNLFFLYVCIMCLYGRSFLHFFFYNSLQNIHKRNLLLFAKPLFTLSPVFSKKICSQYQSIKSKIFAQRQVPIQVQMTDTALSHTEELQSHLHLIDLIDNKHTFITSLKDLNNLLESSTQPFSETFTIAFISKLFKKLFSTRIFQLGLHQDSQVKTELFEVLNEPNVPKLALYKAILQILEHLPSSSLGDSKLDYDRKGVFEEVLLSTILDPEQLPKLFIQVYSIKLSNEFTEILRTLFNFPNLVSNFLETCPPTLRPENFYKNFMKISLEQENSFKKNKSHYYLQFLNSLFINGQTSIFR